MTKETQALIEAAEAMMRATEKLYGWHEPEMRAWKRQLQAAISSAKAAEEGVETKIAILERCVWNMEHDAYRCSCGSMDTEADAYMKVAEVEVREKEGL